MRTVRAAWKTVGVLEMRNVKTGIASAQRLSVMANVVHPIKNVTAALVVRHYVRVRNAARTVVAAPAGLDAHQRSFVITAHAKYLVIPVTFVPTKMSVRLDTTASTIRRPLMISGALLHAKTMQTARMSIPVILMRASVSL